MKRNIHWILMFCVTAVFVVCGCDSEPAPSYPQMTQPPVQVPQAAPIPQQPQPVAAPVPVAPPPTPLTPVIEETPTTGGKKPRPGGGGIDRRIPGPATEGDEHIGAYSCQVTSKKLSLGPLKLPSFGCRIFRANDGTLKIGSSSSNTASMRGSIKDSTPLGFFVVGSFNFPGNKLAIKTRMVRRAGAKVYKGKGRGRLNNNKANVIQYNLTMTRK